MHIMQTMLNNNRLTETSVTPRRVLAAVIVVTFVIMQFFSVVHAAEHPFHDAEISCDSYHAIEKNKSTTADYSLFITVSRVVEISPAEINAGFSLTFDLTYQSRAPPLHS